MDADKFTPIWPSVPTAALQAALPQLASTTTEPNPSLQAEIVACRALQGDWVAALVAPGAIRLLLLPGGGALWGDIPPGQARYLGLNDQHWRFVAAEAEGLGSYQYCDLVPSLQNLSGMAEARLIAEDALATIGAVAPPAHDPPAEPQPLSRRGFFRRLGGHR